LRRQKTREHGLADQRQRYTEFERRYGGPFAGAFLTGGIEDFFDQRLPVFFESQDIARDLYQVTVQFSLVPFREHVAHLRRGHAQQFLHDLVSLAD